MTRYKDYMANVYHDHIVVSFECPGTPGRRTLLIPISAAVAECENQSAAIALAKKRCPPADAPPTSELRPPVLIGFDESGALACKGPEAAVAKLLGIEPKAEKPESDAAQAVARSEPFPLDADQVLDLEKH